MDPPHESEAERERWRRLLSGEDTSLNVPGKRAFRTVPSPPRCKMCNVPFAGPGGLVFGHLGFARWSKNPRLCEACHKTLAKLNIFKDLTADVVKRSEVSASAVAGASAPVNTSGAPPSAAAEAAAKEAAKAPAKSIWGTIKSFFGA